MNGKVLSGVGALVLATGCLTGPRAYMDSPLSDRAESASVWNRPQEVGFDLGEEASGEAQQQCLFGFICWGMEGGGVSMLGQGAVVEDPLVRAAAAVAVSNTARADGIFVVAHDTDSFNILIFQRRVAHVRGRTFTLRRIGEVSQERADKYRNLSALSGKALVQVAP